MKRREIKGLTPFLPLIMSSSALIVKYLAPASLIPSDRTLSRFLNPSTAAFCSASESYTFDRVNDSKIVICEREKRKVQEDPMSSVTDPGEVRRQLTVNPPDVAHTPPWSPRIAALETFPVPTRFVSTYAVRLSDDQDDWPVAKQTFAGTMMWKKARKGRWAYRSIELESKMQMKYLARTWLTLKVMQQWKEKGIDWGWGWVSATQQQFGNILFSRRLPQEVCLLWLAVKNKQWGLDLKIKYVNNLV